jgi:2-polyprenyl-6-methoxyphenol hydroxylase-like FAD-dependent oxidoreductase
VKRVTDEDGLLAPGFAHAIVVGGSIAGLVAAQVLTSHFDRVTILDRDTFPVGVGSRKGVPQACHVHVLLARGREALEELFPGLQDELGRAGAPWINVGTELAWYLPAGWKQIYPSPIAGRAASRDLFESTLRARVKANPNVCLIEAVEVTGFLHEGGPGKGRVTGVSYRHRNGGESAKRISAGLVVDTTGRHSKAPHWLESFGYPVPDQTVVNAFLGYASRFYELPQGFKATWKMLVIHPAAPTILRGGALLSVEGDRCIVTLGGMGKQYPPTDEEGFLDYARSLRSPLLYEAIAHARPLGDIAGYRRTENHMRHYERLRRRPENFVVLGDAVCAFNPVYGQGMTTGTLGAVALGRLLARYARDCRGDLTGLAGHFQRRLARINETPWLLATSEDFRCPITEGARPGLATRLAQGYFTRVLARATTDKHVCQAMLEVTHLLKHPMTLFQPGIMWRTMRPASSSANPPAPDRY